MGNSYITEILQEILFFSKLFKDVTAAVPFRGIHTASLFSVG